MPAWANTECDYCGALLAQRSSGRPRRYCSAACKQTAYRERVTKLATTAQAVSGHIRIPVVPKKTLYGRSSGLGGEVR